MKELLELLKQARVIDLAQSWFVGMPHWPTHPPFAMAMTKEHGDYVLPGGVSAAAELIALGTHVGTHIDGLGHFSCNGLLFQGKSPSQVGIDQVAPIIRRGVLLDVAGYREMAEDEGIGPDELERAARCEIEEGDVVLIRTGWGRQWNNARAFVNEQRQPGITLEGAKWLSSKSIFAAGADNVALERVPSPRMEVHMHLLVESGIHIIECLNLEQLAQKGVPHGSADRQSVGSRAANRDWEGAGTGCERVFNGVAEFLFLAAPLKIVGATGSPLRPFAIVEE
ncbi:cyclase family protein [uncultured Paludibaculum sp.]|uniref:cyclase family protein n=1 Tax=uncultured Paludibaculum sp. TaxID=1765020 RepID=UPI002AAB4F5D|nr:cyclase family protein [uncultured Paludibaculum sp.]